MARLRRKDATKSSILVIRRYLTSPVALSMLCGGTRVAGKSLMPLNGQSEHVRYTSCV
jgi:hypothetical protein